MAFRTKGLSFQFPGFALFAHSNPPVHQKSEKKKREGLIARLG